MTDRRISCIICAYNEERTIGATLAALEGHPTLKEIIVVSDGSTDQTEAVVRRYAQTRLISIPKNAGKSAALARGLAAATGELIMILDADLIGLTAADVAALAEPVLAGRASISISVRANSLGIYRAIGLDFVSGERVFPAALLRGREEEIGRLPGWGFEVFFNRIVIERALPLSIVRWRNVYNNRKIAKMGFFRGSLVEARMVLSVIRLISIEEIIAQNYRLLRLERRTAPAGLRSAERIARDTNSQR